MWEMIIPTSFILDLGKKIRKNMPKKVTVYTTSYCPYCTRAKNLLKGKNISFEEIDLTNDDKTRMELEEKTGWMTVPMIFIGDEFIGGADNLYLLDSKGELEKKVRSAHE